MSYTTEEIKAALAKMSAEIVELISLFEKETEVEVSRVNLQRDARGYLACGLDVTVSGSAYMMPKRLAS